MHPENLVEGDSYVVLYRSTIDKESRVIAGKFQRMYVERKLVLYVQFTTRSGNTVAVPWEDILEVNGPKVRWVR